MTGELRIAEDLALPIDAVTAFLARGRHTVAGCYEWTGSRLRNGYGRYFVPGTGGKRMVLVHRLAFAVATGQWPAVVRHKCDNKLCFRSDHLLGGTTADNVADRVARSRSATGGRNGATTRPDRVPRGERHGNHRLTARQVAEIRRRYLPRHPTRRALAAEYGVSKNTIDRVLRGEWG